MCAATEYFMSQKRVGQGQDFSYRNIVFYIATENSKTWDFPFLNIVLYVTTMLRARQDLRARKSAGHTTTRSSHAHNRCVTTIEVVYHDKDFSVAIDFSQWLQSTVLCPV